MEEKREIKSSENDQLTDHFKGFFLKKNNSRTSKPAVCIKSLNLIIFLKIFIGQSLLTMSLSKKHRQNLSKIYYFYQLNK